MQKPSFINQQLSQRYAAGERDFSGLDLCEANLRAINLCNCDLSNIKLSVADLSGANLSLSNLNQARLNVARLTGANLSQATLNQTLLNVANLIQADLRQADLRQALIIHAELIRAQLSGANLTGANLTGSDLREITAKNANFAFNNLNESNLRGAVCAGANFEQIIATGADFSRADFQDANFREAELRQINFSRSNLSGADLRGANLRWADLSGANLSWANLSNVKLSGANLIGADLTKANLTDASLVHADLTNACLKELEWSGADLTGATLTGAKLYGVSHFGLKILDLICEWVDLSPQGDRSQVYQFTPTTLAKFFDETQPKIIITIDEPLNLQANYLLASMYQKICHAYPPFKKPPSIKITNRQTQLTFNLDHNDQLFPLAYLGIFPFSDYQATHQHLLELVNALKLIARKEANLKKQHGINHLATSLTQILSKFLSLQDFQLTEISTRTIPFFQAPTQTVLINSGNKKLLVYQNRYFGKGLQSNTHLAHQQQPETHPPVKLPPPSVVIAFIQELLPLATT